ncbi:MAG: hypothetical protein K2P78_03765, partial [Gemmataceae bacterium]|nr:hypothetical protein [Gemmataceae bacterium]
MKTAAPLSDRSKKELGDMARRKGIRGWEAMSKEQLVRTLSRAAKPAAPAKRKKRKIKKKEVNKGLLYGVIGGGVVLVTGIILLLVWYFGRKPTAFEMMVYL